MKQTFTFKVYKNGVNSISMIATPKGFEVFAYLQKKGDQEIVKRVHIVSNKRQKDLDLMGYSKQRLWMETHEKKGRDLVGNFVKGGLNWDLFNQAEEAKKYLEDISISV